MCLIYPSYPWWVCQWALCTCVERGATELEQGRLSLYHRSSLWGGHSSRAVPGPTPSDWWHPGPHTDTLPEPPLPDQVGSAVALQAQVVFQARGMVALALGRRPEGLSLQKLQSQSHQQLWISPGSCSLRSIYYFNKASTVYLKFKFNRAKYSFLYLIWQ